MPALWSTAGGDPHRMGAALTYAQRYALFTLVGHCRGGRHRCAWDLMASTNPLRVGEAEGEWRRLAERRATKSISTRSSPPRR